MATAVELAKLPFTAGWYLLKLVFLPALIVTVAYLLLGADSVWFVGITVVCGVWALALVRLWSIKLRGVLRALGRGTVQISGDDPYRGARRRRGRRRGDRR